MTIDNEISLSHLLVLVLLQSTWSRIWTTHSVIHPTVWGDFTSVIFVNPEPTLKKKSPLAVDLYRLGDCHTHLTVHATSNSGVCFIVSPRSTGMHKAVCLFCNANGTFWTIFQLFQWAAHSLNFMKLFSENRRTLPCVSIVCM